MASVELANVRKIGALENLSLSIAPGELVVLTGPADSGKTALLRLVAGLERVCEGEIRIGGRRVDGLPPQERDVGLVPRSGALAAHMTVRELLALAPTLRRMPGPEAESRVRHVSLLFGLAALLDRRADVLSREWQQRVALARALVLAPRVLLCDEPFADLDASARVRLLSELLAAHRQAGTTTLHATRDPLQAMSIATQVVVLRGGLVQQIGPPVELFHRPLNRFVASWFGRPAMNFIEGDVGSGPSFGATGVWVPISHRAALELPIGSKATLGIRPHDLTLGEGEPGDVLGEIELVESLGWEAWVHVRTDAGRLVARLEGPHAAAARAGDRIAMRIAADRVLLFDARGVCVQWPHREPAPAPASVRP